MHDNKHSDLFLEMFITFFWRSAKIFPEEGGRGESLGVMIAPKIWLHALFLSA